MVAPETLNLFVMVRIHVGQPVSFYGCVVFGVRHLLDMQDQMGSSPIATTTLWAISVTLARMADYRVAGVRIPHRLPLRQIQQNKNILHQVTRRKARLVKEGA